MKIGDKVKTPEGNGWITKIVIWRSTITDYWVQLEKDSPVSPRKFSPWDVWGRD